MESNADKPDMVHPHHEQQPLCTTRLPYRQGRKLTAVKVYTINDESNHLLIFGIPSLNLRQEAKSMFLKFGKLTQFIVTMEHPAEPFTDTYHAVYEKIHSARLAKKLMDTKTFYGGALHICYAPELESVDETRQKLLQRQRDVIFRLKNLQKDEIVPKKPEKTRDIVEKDREVLNMGDVNVIATSGSVMVKKKRKITDNIVKNTYAPCFISKDAKIRKSDDKNNDGSNSDSRCDKNINDIKDCDDIEVIDCTSTEVETVSSIEKSLNYNKFGSEIIRKVPSKPVNKIVFHIGNKR